MMRSTYVLSVVLLLSVACNRYSYPVNPPVSAVSTNQTLLVSAATGPYSTVTFKDMACQGKDYKVHVSYDTTFDSPTEMALQYQVVPKSFQTVIVFTYPTGEQKIDPMNAKGELELIVPAAQVESKESTLLLRLRVKTKLVYENTSNTDSVQISQLCQ